MRKNTQMAPQKYMNVPWFPEQATDAIELGQPGSNVFLNYIYGQFFTATAGDWRWKGSAPTGNKSVQPTRRE